MTAPAPLAERVLSGDHGAIARALTQVERRAPGTDTMLAELHRRVGHAHVIGVTGPPGSGKSTLVTAMTEEYRRAGRSVGIIAVDPSSVFTSGAILGDRIRMSALSGDPGVFIRSIATRGALGGLARAALDAVTVLDAAGRDIVVLETVGVGQAETDVISGAQSVAVVSVPGLGDSVQAIKAGLLEIADVHVVNKSDREGAHRTVSELREMLRLTKRQPGQWNVPIEQTVADRGTGVPALVERFDEHLRWMERNGERERRAHRAAGTRIRWAAEELVRDWLRPGTPAFDEAVEQVAGKYDDPVAAARRLVGRT